MAPKEPTEHDAFLRSFDDIPYHVKIKRMTLSELASEWSSSKPVSHIYQVFEREIKKHLAQDQARINRPNMLWAAGLGGLFALAGVVLGWCLQQATNVTNVPVGSEKLPIVESSQQLNILERTKETPHMPSVKSLIIHHQKYP